MFKKKNSTNIFQTILLFVLIVLCLCIFFILFWTPRENLLIQNKIPSYHIVVAKYKEDITWFSHMDRQNLYVYDKSGDEKSPFTPLENKGREGSTFLGHIIKYYDNLPEYIILVQGNPFPHMHPDITPQNFQDKINRVLEKRPDNKQPLFSDYVEEPSFLYEGLILDEYIELLFDTKATGMVRFVSGNQYIIPRNIIVKRPKAFYQKLWKMSIKGDHFDINDAHFEKRKLNPSEIKGWSLERIFDMIISEVPINKKFLS